MVDFVRSGFIIDNAVIAAGSETSGKIVFASGDKDTSFFILATQTGSMQIQIDPRGDGTFVDLDASIVYATANKWQSFSLDFKLPTQVRVVFTPNVYPCTATVMAQGSGVR